MPDVLLKIYSSSNRVTQMESEYKVVCALSNVDIVSDLHLVTTFC